ncbi:hypothetical protein CJ305_07780 [Leeuwenhoekiella nanhaiensis]|uniref:Peptidase S54 rhomboid domain-containing protein n=2 Tax=Leeuwenhoekiella nanhaiensis TaxID=1655491 RepID=A0A2G1VTD4_9FLAO|nr:hypothetical protein CJ305_07780 [Leeuwenhoekiella nanhaiensis]
MKDFRIKLKEIYLPFVLVSICTIFFYNLFRWVFDIRLGILPLKEDLLDIWIPFIIPVLPVSIWLRRPIRILKLKDPDRGRTAIQALMIFAIVAPIVISQQYIKKAAFDLVTLENASEIKSLGAEKYFKINNFRVNKDARVAYATARTSGKGNDRLNFFLYLACPFENAENAWYGVEYNESTGNTGTTTQQNAWFSNFLKYSERDFANYPFQDVSYFEKVAYSDHWDGYMQAIKNESPSAVENQQIILIPKADEFEERLGDTLPWVFGSFGIGCMVILLSLLYQKIDESTLSNFKKNKPLEDDDLRAILRFLNPLGSKGGTAILIFVNIGVFVGMIFSGISFVSPTGTELLELGGLRKTEVVQGEYWRLFTSIFIHSGFIHLVMNMVGLVFGAILLEDVLGKVRFILSFIACGVLASFASIYWHENIVSVGASGAIFGLYGLILAFTVFRIYSTGTRTLTWGLLVLYAGVSLIFGFFSTGVDNAAHVGGLLSGFILGVLLIAFDKENLIKTAG